MRHTYSHSCIMKGLFYPAFWWAAGWSFQFQWKQLFGVWSHLQMAIYSRLSSTPTHQTTFLRDFSLGFNVLSKQNLSRGKGIFLCMLLSVIICNTSITIRQPGRHRCVVSVIISLTKFWNEWYIWKIIFFSFLNNSMNLDVDNRNDQEFGLFPSPAVISNQRDNIGHFCFRITNAVPFV